MNRRQLITSLVGGLALACVPPTTIVVAKPSTTWDRDPHERRCRDFGCECC